MRRRLFQKFLFCISAKHSVSCRDKRQHNDYSVYGRQNEEHAVDGQHRGTGDRKTVIYMKKGYERKYGGEEYSDSEDGEYDLEFFHRVYTCLFKSLFLENLI